MTNPQTPKTRMVCCACGSDEVKADAYAVWDGWAWQILAVFDKGSICEACDGETRLKEVPA